MLFDDDFSWLSLLIPILLALYFLVVTLATRDWGKSRIRLSKASWLLMGGCVAAYAKVGASFTLLILASVWFNYGIARAVERALDPRERTGPFSSASARSLLWTGIAANLLFLAIFRYADFLAGDAVVVRAIRPVGMSFLAFHAVSYLFDVYRGEATAQTRPLHAAVYLLAFPMFVAAPIGYRFTSGYVARRFVGISDFSYGARRFLIGLSKKLLIANTVGVAADQIFSASPARLTAPVAWLGAVCYGVQVYFAFSGYADMAVGLGRMFGYRTPENFRWPYVAGTVQEFWLRWHVGLWSWFRDYFPRPGWNDRSRSGPVVAHIDAEHGDVMPSALGGGEIAIVLLCALWYGATWPCLIWGLYHATFLWLERRGLADRLKPLPSPFRHIYLIVVVTVGWVFFRSTSVSGALLFLKAMAGFNTPVRPFAPSLPVEFWLALVTGIVGTAPLVAALSRWSVTIDSLTTSVLMMLFVTSVLVWRHLSQLARPVFAWWRDSVRRSPAA